MMIGTGTPHGRFWPRVLLVAVGLGLAAGIAWARPGRHVARRSVRQPTRVVTIRQVVVRREPVVIRAVTLAQLRAELRRARLAQVGYERQVARQYATIRQLQGRLDAQMRQAQSAASDRAAQLDAQFEIIVQAFGLIVFAIIGALLVALSRSHDSPRPSDRSSAGDWDPLQHQLQDARNALATVELRLQRLERQ
jgi:hypothetical protein